MKKSIWGCLLCFCLMMTLLPIVEARMVSFDMSEESHFPMKAVFVGSTTKGYNITATITNNHDYCTVFCILTLKEYFEISVESGLRAPGIEAVLAPHETKTMKFTDNHETGVRFQDQVIIMSITYNESVYSDLQKHVDVQYTVKVYDASGNLVADSEGKNKDYFDKKDMTSDSYNKGCCSSFVFVTFLGLIGCIVVTRIIVKK
jgi:hypothetical protein